jgi:hypothetical protein
LRYLRLQIGKTNSNFIRKFNGAEN